MNQAAIVGVVTLGLGLFLVLMSPTDSIAVCSGVAFGVGGIAMLAFGR
jgi:hypothetical protein